MAKITLAKGLNAGLRAAMENDPKVLVLGEDVGKLGGVFRITDGLQKDFGEDRVIDTPLAEPGGYTLRSEKGKHLNPLRDKGIDTHCRVIIGDKPADTIAAFAQVPASLV